MIVAIADTHTVVWYLANDSRLSLNARTVFSDAVSHDNEIGISTITLVEIIYLIEKGRLATGRFTQLMTALDDIDSILTEVSLTPAIARTLSQIERTQIPDMPDRIIAATGLYLDIPVISRDSKISASRIKTIW